MKGRNMTSIKTESLQTPPKLRTLQPDATGSAARVDSNLVEAELPGVSLAVDEMAFTRQGDLDAYARGLSIPPETIEKWISAGLLFPDEIRMAEKIIKILREKIKVS